jgi:hypothetical protein
MFIASTAINTALERSIHGDRMALSELRMDRRFHSALYGKLTQEPRSSPARRNQKTGQRRCGLALGNGPLLAMSESAANVKLFFHSIVA